MILTIQFSQPYQRFQVENAFNNLALPTGAVVSVRNESRWDELGVNAETRLDTIDVVRVTEVNSFVEASVFLQSLPAAAFSRISRISIS